MTSPITNPNNFAHPGLHWSQRPPELVQRIQSAFEAISQETSSAWGAYNGSKTYGICGVDEHKLMKRLILEAPPEQKDFYILEIGAGNFQWENGFADYLNKQTDLPSDIRIHIIGIRGEQYLDNPIEENGRCKIYRLGGFKVEELESEFKKLRLDLNNKIDLAASNWCIRHLADPTGTVLQTYHLLRPKTGILLVDGFFFLYQNQSLYKNCDDQIVRINRLFLATRAPFITQLNDGGQCLNHYMLRRIDGASLQIPMQYDSTEAIDRTGYQIGSETVTSFKVESQEEGEIFPVVNWPRDMDHLGDKRLHEWLRQNHLLLKPDIAWQPLLSRDLLLAHPSLHQAILAKDDAAISQCLENGCDINESDSFGTITFEAYQALTSGSLPTGRTPLHLALETRNLPLFKTLLNRGADATLSDDKGQSVLHLAAENEVYHDFLVEILKTSQREWNPKIYGKTPLDLAISSNNLFAIQALLEKGVMPTFAQSKVLREEAFSSIHSLLPMPIDERPEFQQILAHIRAGDTVILSQNDNRGGEKIFMPQKNKNAVADSKKLIKVSVDPSTELLNFAILKVIEAETGCKAVSYHPTWPEFQYKFKDYAVVNMEFNALQKTEEKPTRPAIRLRSLKLDEGKRD